jgi:hypothetical protein
LAQPLSTKRINKYMILAVVIIVILAVSLVGVLILDRSSHNSNNANNVGNSGNSNANSSPTVTLTPDTQTVTIPQGNGIALTAQFTLQVSDVSPVQSIEFHTGTYSYGQENVYNMSPSQLNPSYPNFPNTNTVTYQFEDGNDLYENAGNGVYQGYCTITDANGNTYSSNLVTIVVQ